MILAGDIGGTNVRLALFDRSLRERLTVVFPTREQDSLGSAVATFLAGAGAEVESACFAVAGPVVNGAVRGPNLPWPVYGHELAEAFGIPAVTVVNDLEANARGVESLGRESLLTINRGTAQAHGTRAVVSAGTGLGEAALVWNGRCWHALASEGGHADFAPRTDIEASLQRWLAAEFGHVSYERILSGGGLVNVYRFLGGDFGRDAAAITAEAGVDERSLAAHALELFASVYGAHAGNVALSYTATGGVYLGGGIAPRIARTLANGAFMRAFADKGRLSGLVEAMPVHVILDDRTALNGAARIASDHAPATALRRAA